VAGGLVAQLQRLPQRLLCGGVGEQFDLYHQLHHCTLTSCDHVITVSLTTDALVIGGSLSNAEPLVATIRGVIYERCLPLATRNLEIATSRAGRDASVLGAGQLMLEASDAWIDRVLER
jgi:hypothetical protein